ncbi:hypothetical protein FOA43_000649 [Brettanomyces nanus]|uniref:Nuclear pore complex protein n=1 Tax=Eeniella nana TaxID=13502 RepID=A0A875S0D2_EENNA|nr:uncharacterized protein FOA43_000649 [Brettanomyces nanus]QPG73339.1 hypothetical protein FOA43_000649 [Brettanomyces nanus]
MVSSTDQSLDTQDIDLLIDNDDVQTSFARVLKDFRLNFGETQLGDIIDGFKKISYKQLLEVYNKEKLESSGKELENWILEGKLWSLIQSLLDVKFSKELMIDGSNRKKNNDIEWINGDICSYSSDTVLQDRILSENDFLLQVYSVFKALSKDFNLDLNHSDDIDLNQLQLTKWMNTKMSLQSNQASSNLVSQLDADAPLRTNAQVDPRDIQKDALFYQKAFNLLISDDISQVNELCKQTNNWDFAIAVCGLQDFVNPAIDLGDFDAHPVGIKQKLLWRRAVYKVVSSALSKPEAGCYGYLCGDFLSAEELVSNWEEKLVLYLNNLLQCCLEEKLIACYKKLGKFSDIDMIYTLSSPPQASTDVNDVLNKLAADKNPEIRLQSRHPIRVMIGSIISDNVQTLMSNTLQLLNDILDSNNGGNELTEDSYMLRILTHLAILLQLIYGSRVISNIAYTKLLKSYVVRLALYKSYDQIPVYVSYIPNDKELIDVYSHFLTRYSLTHDEMRSQLRLMRQLNLPLEAILRDTVAKSFDSTTADYPVDREIVLDSAVTDMDKALYCSIYWFYESGMSADCLESVVMLMRRFLACGKLQAAIEFMDTIALPKVIDDYRRKTSIIDDSEIDETLKPYLISKSKLSELIQYQYLIDNFNMMNKFQIDEGDNAENLKKVIALAASLDKLLKTWMYDLATNGTVELDVKIYQELRRIYIPTIFNSLFELLTEHRYLSEEVLLRQAVDMVNLLADNKYRFYDLFSSTDQLKPFLQKFAAFSCKSFGERPNGIYT